MQREDYTTGWNWIMGTENGTYIDVDIDLDINVETDKT